MRPWSLIPLLVLVSVLRAFELRETPEQVIVSTPHYEALFSRQGAALTLRKDGATILSGWAASGAEGAFLRGAKKQKLGALEKVQREGETVLLDYNAGGKDASFRIEIEPRKDRLRLTVRPLQADADMVAGFAWDLESAGQWYGGGFQGWRDSQTWPLNKALIEKSAFLASSLSQGTPLWYTTKGLGVWVRTPIDFGYSVNRVVEGKPDGRFCISMPKSSALTYDLLVGGNLRTVLRIALEEIGLPRRSPGIDLIRSTIYTTWVEHKDAVDQAKVLEYARAIRKHALPAEVVEIDAKWELLYGDMEFDPKKFPDPRAMVDELHRLGFRVTLWVHPFVNTNTKNFAAHLSDGLLLRDSTGRPGVVKWWEGIAAIWDFTEPRAGMLFRAKLDSLRQRFGFDGFKFDGGDVHFVVKDAKPARAMSAAEYPDWYNAEATAHYAWHETRVGIYSQPLGVIQRLIDKHSVWGFENGLAAVVPEAIIASQRGFFFVMPDMIGGNQYEDDKIDAELMIRWAQASALMPLMQFSVGPWHHGEEAVRLCRAATELHLAFTPLIHRLAEASTLTGEPILASLVYQYPDDTETFTITDQFMLGKDVVVAPVVAKGAVQRDLYLPRGRWVDRKTRQVLEGGRWLRAYPAPLDLLPLFVREGSEAAAL
jgi:hypothetical protein